MDMTPTSDPAAADAGDGASGVPASGLPASGQTVDMSQVAGARDVPVLPDDADKKAKKHGKDAAREMTAIAPTSGALAEAEEAIKELGTKRGIETLFRSSYRVNMDLSSLADAKANIMISINGLIVSILIASIAPGMEKNPWLFIPTSLFLLGCLVSLVFAVLAARPRVVKKLVTPEEALRDRKNLLFFGNFSHMSEGQYVDSIKQVVADPNRTYEMMIKDIYGVGSVLQKKYEMLQRSYNTFMTALVIGVLGFILVFGYTRFADVQSPTTIVTQPAPTTEAAPATGILP